jgi:hypothetical protein
MPETSITIPPSQNESPAMLWPGTNSYRQFVTTGEFDAASDVGSRNAPDDHGRATWIRQPNPEPSREFVALAFRADDFARQTRLEFSMCNFFEHLLFHRDWVVPHFGADDIASRLASNFLNAASSITFPVIETGVISHFAIRKTS